MTIYRRGLTLGRLPLAGYTDSGVRLNHAVDNTGRELRLRSAQIFWMKEKRFELELAADSEAQTVTVDVSYTTRSGLQHVSSTLPIDRSGRTDYRTQLNRWRRTAEAERRP